MLTETQPSPARLADPATPDRRRELARRMLAAAIQRYEDACLEWTEVHESFPHLDPPRPPENATEAAERAAWRSLMTQADETFNLAEQNLAERINALFTMLDREGRLPLSVEPVYFVPRAVRHRGTVYVLSFSSFEYEPRKNIIATYRESLVIDLAEGHDEI